MSNWRSLAARVFAKHEESKNWIVALAVLIGGAWTGFTFRELNQAQLADAAVDDMRKALAEVEIDATAYSGAGGSCMMEIVATVRNEGRRKLRLDFTEPRLQLAYATFDTTNALAYAGSWGLFASAFQRQKDTLGVVDLPETVLIPGERVSYPYLVKLPRDDIVLFAEFAVPVHEQVIDQGQRRWWQPLGGTPGADTAWAWTARKYLFGCAVDQRSSTSRDR